MRIRGKTKIGLAAFFLAVFAISCGQVELSDTKMMNAGAEVSPSATPFFYTFRYPDRLREHFEKHGAEMGFDSEQAYLEAANAVIRNPEAYFNRQIKQKAA